MQANDSSSNDNIKPDDYSSFLPRINVKMERKYWARYKEPMYPFSQVLRFRVLQVGYFLLLNSFMIIIMPHRVISFE